jgi:hypothetical protein
MSCGGEQWGQALESEPAGLQHMLLEALDLLQAALDLLDRAAAPAQIGAHVDLAIHQLGSAVATEVDAAGAADIDRAVASR